MSLVKIKQFGQAMASRTEGREAALSTIAYQFQGAPPTEVTLDFQDVLIMTPSWLGEYVQTLIEKGVQHLQYINKSALVESSIEFVENETRSSGS